MNKLIYIDVETTGLSAKRNDIIQLAGIIEIDKEVVDYFNIRVQPHNYANIEQAALNVNKRTVEEIKTFQSPREAYKDFTSLLSKYINKFDKNDKAYMIAYNGRFDLEFLHEWFIKCGDKYFGSFFNWRVIDPIQMVDWMQLKGALTLTDRKLETLCEYFGIELDAHDAMRDIEATRELTQKLLEVIEILPWE